MSDDNQKASLFSIYTYSPERAGRGPFLFGFVLLIPFVLLFGAWSTFAPLEAAAIAEGQVILNKDVKTVQHFEGGIVEKILVQEGAYINKGDPVIIIRDFLQRNQLTALYENAIAARALKARLKAEYFQNSIPDFSSITGNYTIDPSRLDELISLQEQQFKTRQRNLDARLELIRNQKKQSRKEIDGIKAQMLASEKQLKILKQELEEIAPLQKKGIVLKTRKLELKKQIISIEGQIGSFKSNIARIEQSILSGDLEALSSTTELQKMILDELQSAELSIKQAESEIISLEDSLQRTVVTAPTSGKVMNLEVHTLGAVLSPGATIMDIVPQDDRLIIEANVLPTDIDLVRPGLKAKVLLSAYKAKKVPKLDGVVESISGDALLDEATGMSYFSARIVVDETIFNQLKSNIELYPGMPAQVFLLDEPRTLALYLGGPIMDATYKAFREE